LYDSGIEPYVVRMIPLSENSGFRCESSMVVPACPALSSGEV
jgi:hypothetical protein